MRVYQSEMMKRNIQFILFLGLSLLSVITIVFNIKSTISGRVPLLIAIDSNGTRIINKKDDPIFTTEAVGFINKFTTSIYNFDSKNFMSKVGSATGMMSDELWKQKKNAIVDLRSRVEKDEISIEGELTKLTKDESGIYYGLVHIKEKSRLSVTEKTIKVEISLKSRERSEFSPYGMEIDKYEETLIHE
jgi:hypothetical protein